MNRGKLHACSIICFAIVAVAIIIIIIIIMRIIYTKKLLNSDWLRKECKMYNLSAKGVIQCKLHIEILDYDWLMNNRV